MRRFVDLHTHSSASDGTCPPEEIVRLAEAERLAAVALTDHDTTEGIASAAAAAREFPDLRFIAGIEISAIFPGGTLHILGLGIDETADSLQLMTRRLRAARQERNPKIVAKLQSLGLAVEMEDVLAVAAEARGGRIGGIVGRLHIAETLRRKGIVRTINEAFEKYLGVRGSAFVDKERLMPGEAIANIHHAGGLAILAHPPHLQYHNRAQLERIVRDLITCGLDAIEVYHCDHSTDQTRLYLDLARRLDIGVTGGSDFHGGAKPGARLGRPRVPLAAITGKLARLSLRTDQGST